MQTQCGLIKTYQNFSKPTHFPISHKKCVEKIEIKLCLVFTKQKFEFIFCYVVHLGIILGLPIPSFVY